MDKRVIIFSAVVVIAVVLFFSFNRAEPQSEVCFESVCVAVDVVDEPDTRAQGLMFVEEMGEFNGMFFIFDEIGHYPFWMKNTLIPLDIIWIDEEFKIVHIAQAEPCQEDPCVIYDPVVDSLYVVEVNKGFAQEQGIETGQFIEFRR